MKDFEIEPSTNKRILFMRFIHGWATNVGSTHIYITPEYLRNKYEIDLQTIQSVLTELEEHELVEILQRPNHKLTAEQRYRRDDEEDYYLVSTKDGFDNYYQSLEQTESFHRANVVEPKSNNTSSNYAELSFESISIPTVTINDTVYKLPSMREGLPLAIISYCLEYRPNVTLERTVLKSELTAKGIKSPGLVNIRDNIRNSLFGDKHPLSIFIVVSPHAILVKPNVYLTNEQVKAIKLASQKT